MIPLTLADEDVEHVIVKVSGKPETRQHLENLGFVVGSPVTVITSINGNVIVKIKECRVAISVEMAQKIMI